MMIANPEVYVMSPNRDVPTRTWNPIEVIENYIAKIPEMDVSSVLGLMSSKAR